MFYGSSGARAFYRDGHFGTFVYGSFCGIVPCDFLEVLEQSLSPIYALMSASSFSESPLWGFTLTRRVAAPTVTPFWSLINE
jgi:hypothetical protein